MQGEETCEMAFKGRRDLVLFTNKRILFVDKQGWSGNKMAFTSFPYTSVKVFNVTTAGKAINGIMPMKRRITCSVLFKVRLTKTAS